MGTTILPRPELARLPIPPDVVPWEFCECHLLNVAYAHEVYEAWALECWEVQLVKHDPPSGTSLGFAFPDAPWSRTYFEPLQAALRAKGVAYSVSETGDEPTRRFIEVECAGDPVESALEVSRVAAEVLGFGDGDLFCASLKGDLDSAAVISRSVQAIREGLAGR